MTITFIHGTVNEEETEPATSLLVNICCISPLITVLMINMLHCHIENYVMVLNSSSITQHKSQNQIFWILLLTLPLTGWCPGADFLTSPGFSPPTFAGGWQMKNEIVYGKQ
jgi:hypothetical protein